MLPRMQSFTNCILPIATPSLPFVQPHLVPAFLRWKSSSSYVPKRSSFPGEVVESVKLQDGQTVCASVTVTLQPPGHLGMQKGIAAVVTASWELVRSCLKGQRPHILLMYTSLGKPLARAAAKQLAKIANHGLAAPVVVAGCSASRWRPEGESPRTGQSEDTYRAHHLSFTAAYLPDITLHPFTSDTDSLPSLPLLEEALGSRPPQFMLFTHPTNQYAANQSNLLMKRFENIFPGSNIFGVVADYIDAKERPMFVQNGVAVKDNPAPASASASTDVQSSSIGRKRKGPSRSPLSPAPEECPATQSPASASSSSDGRPSASADSVFKEMEDSPGSLLFVSDDKGAIHVLERGSVGVALYPASPTHRLPPQSVLNLVRVMAGGFRFEASNKMLLSDQVLQLMSALHAPTRQHTVASIPEATVGAQEDSEGPTPTTVSPESSISGSSGRVEHAWSAAAIVSPKGIQQQKGRQLKPPSQLASEIPMFVLADMSLFPDQVQELKVFEPRYQLLARQCAEQGGSMGISYRGVGTFARITGCRVAENGNCVVEVLGGARFSYVPNSARVLPACFGLTVAQVEALQDDAPGSDYEGPTCDLAVQALQLLLQEWVSQIRKRSLVESSAAALAASEDLARARQMHASLSAGFQRTSIVMTDTAVDMKKKVVEEMDVLQAQAVSLWLGGLLSNTIVPPYMKREWLSSRNTYVRLGQQVQLLSQHYQLRREAVLTLMRQTSHPLRKMLAIF